MGTNRVITKMKFIRTLKEKGVIFFDSSDIKKLFSIKSNNTVKHLLSSFSKENIIKRIKKGRYMFLFSEVKPTDFAIANNLVIPSYISLESALSYYGFLDQFPYKITSVTLLKSRKFIFNNKEFVYSKIKKEYFKDFLKIDDFLIAKKEKAFFDYFYFIYKGLRSKQTGKELQSFLTQKEIKAYFKENALGKFRKFLEENYNVRL